MKIDILLTIMLLIPPQICHTIFFMLFLEIYVEFLKKIDLFFF